MRKADNLPPSCTIVAKSGNLNFLEPSGLLQACNRTAVPIFLLHVLACECQSSKVITPVLPVVLQPVPDLKQTFHRFLPSWF